MLSGAVTEAERFGLPLIAHIYPRAYNDGVTEIVADPENIAWAVRCGIECGADVIKVTYPGDPGAFRDIIACSPVPVIAAGGPTTDTFREALLQAEAIMTSGASGLTVGRNVWAPGRNTVGAISAYKAVVHEKLGVDDAMKAAEEVGLS
jgi:class I fructose-bisphosphate aldolase